MDKTLLKGLRVLEYLVRSETSVRLTDVANDLGLEKSNAHRVLKTLRSAGYVVQNPRSREFSASLKLWEMGSAVVGRLDLRRHAGEFIRALARKTGETVNLSIMEDGNVIYIDKIDSPQPIGTYTRIGGRAPAYSVATGKAILAYLDEAARAGALQTMEPLTENTIVSMDRLAEDLEETRRRGYAISRAECRPGVWAIAAPILDATGRVIAAVGVSGPDFRMGKQRRSEQLGVMVRRTAAEISQHLGHNGAPLSYAGAGQ